MNELNGVEIQLKTFPSDYPGDKEQAKTQFLENANKIITKITNRIAKEFSNYKISYPPDNFVFKHRTVYYVLTQDGESISLRKVSLAGNYDGDDKPGFFRFDGDKLDRELKVVRIKGTPVWEKTGLFGISLEKSKWYKELPYSGGYNFYSTEPVNILSKPGYGDMYQTVVDNLWIVVESKELIYLDSNKQSDPYASTSTSPGTGGKSRRHRKNSLRKRKSKKSKKRRHTKRR
jgi:hypothetical protein